MLGVKYNSGRGVVHFEIIDASKPQFKRSFLATSLLKARSASQEYPLIEWRKQRFFCGLYFVFSFSYCARKDKKVWLRQGMIFCIQWSRNV